MYQKVTFIFLLFILNSLFSACYTIDPVNNANSQSIPAIAMEKAITSQPVSTLYKPTKTQTPIPTKEVNSRSDATLVSTIVVTPIISPKTNLSVKCPIFVDEYNSPLWTKGSVVFSEGNIIDQMQPDIVLSQPGIWAVSPNTLTKHLVQESAGGAWISPNGTILLDTERDVENFSQDVVFYDIASGSEMDRITIPYDYGFQGWVQDNQVEFGTIIERNEDVGELREGVILDPITQRTETFSKDLILPKFAFNDTEVERGLFYGYSSVDPTGQLVLYSAQENGKDNFEVRLLNLETGEIIWQHDTQYLSSSSPQWSKDGNTVLFDINVPVDDTHSWWKIMALSREGEVGSLSSQPFPFIEEGQLIQYSSSLDGRYLFYNAWVSDEQNIGGKIKAFIIDTVSGEVNELCDPKASFVASVPARGRVGLWLSGNQFVYRVLIEKNGQPTHSLRILDVPTWSTQILFEPDSGYGINTLDWTPMELP